jgi:hypothetical protein
MNIYVSQDIKNRYKCLDFRGKVFTIGDKHYIKAYHRTLWITMFYCFEDDFAYFNSDIRDLRNNLAH